MKAIQDLSGATATSATFSSPYHSSLPHGPQPEPTPSPHPSETSNAELSTENTLDDIFGPSSPASSQNLDVHTYNANTHSEPPRSDSPRLRSIHSTAGYREGISAARDAAVQTGFDEGFLLGAAVGSRVGVLTGVVDGVVKALAATVRIGEDGKGDGVVLAKAKALQKALSTDLRLENVLGPKYVLADGSWGWDVSEDVVAAGGVLAVAEEHPLIRRYAAVVGEWVRVLEMRRIG